MNTGRKDRGGVKIIFQNKKKKDSGIIKKKKTKKKKTSAKGGVFEVPGVKENGGGFEAT